MWQIGVWERDEGLAGALAATAQVQGCVVRCGRHPAQLMGRDFDLLVVSPQAAGWAGAGALHCRTALVPGGLSALTRLLPADRMLSYGMGPANTITLSSIKEGRACVAVQREFPTLEGAPVERQEFVLDYNGAQPDLFLAHAGARLLLGMVQPELGDGPGQAFSPSW